MHRNPVFWIVMLVGGGVVVMAGHGLFPDDATMRIVFNLFGGGLMGAVAHRLADR